jgi:ABC-type amino acid transport system permease subunit
VLPQFFSATLTTLKISIISIILSSSISLIIATKNSLSELENTINQFVKRKAA